MVSYYFCCKKYSVRVPSISLLLRYFSKFPCHAHAVLTTGHNTAFNSETPRYRFENHASIPDHPNRISRQNPQSHALDFMPRVQSETITLVHVFRKPEKKIQPHPPSDGNRWRASKRSLHPTAQISLIPFLFKFESTHKASFGLLSKKESKVIM